MLCILLSSPMSFGFQETAKEIPFVATAPTFLLGLGVRRLGLGVRSWGLGGQL
jgi:hypothetical protein